MLFYLTAQGMVNRMETTPEQLQFLSIVDNQYTTNKSADYKPSLPTLLLKNYYLPLDAGVIS
jgi:hypothetical protein